MRTTDQTHTQRPPLTTISPPRYLHEKRVSETLPFVETLIDPTTNNPDFLKKRPADHGIASWYPNSPREKPTPRSEMNWPTTLTPSENSKAELDRIRGEERR